MDTIKDLLFSNPNNHMTRFKKEHSFDMRCKEAKNMRKKYPDRVPVIVEKNNSTETPEIYKHKYLVPNDLTMGQFIYVIRKRLKLSDSEALFIFVNNTLIPTSESISSVFNKNIDDDGFLYVKYSLENTFGFGAFIQTPNLY